MENGEVARPGLGRLLPGMLYLALLLDGGSRCLRIDPLTFRAWEAVTRYRGPGIPFEANHRYDNEKSYGDLASIGNFPGLRQYRQERFTVDANGYRNTPEIGRRPVSAILAGDSFTVGSGVDDTQTLAFQLERLSGINSYNAGGIEPDAKSLTSLADRLGMRQGIVIYQYLERNDPPAVPTRERSHESPLLRRAKRFILGYCASSPVQILSTRLLKKLENDRILPNRHRINVVRRALSNGDEMLFLPKDVEAAERRRVVSGAYWSWLRESLRARNLDLLVVLVPTSYTVYGSPPSAGEYLARLEKDLTRRGVNTVNLAPSFIQGARTRLSRREYLYWRDDTHWNPSGIQLAAEKIRERLLRRQQPAARRH